MDDVLNRVRINSANVTNEEWALLQTLYYNYSTSWVVPTSEEWKHVAGVLALVDIRRGYDCMTEGHYEFGTANIRINEHGIKALQAREKGEIYKFGKPTNQKDLDRIESNDQCWTTEKRQELAALTG